MVLDAFSLPKPSPRILGGFSPKAVRVRRLAR